MWLEQSNLIDSILTNIINVYIYIRNLNYSLILILSHTSKNVNYAFLQLVINDGTRIVN